MSSFQGAKQNAPDSNESCTIQRLDHAKCLLHLPPLREGSEVRLLTFHQTRDLVDNGVDFFGENIFSTADLEAVRPVAAVSKSYSRFSG
jgi:hypothetical protein